MAAAIRHFGFTMPLMVDEDDLLIAGHRRLDAAHMIGLKSVPTIRRQLHDAGGAVRVCDRRQPACAHWRRLGSGLTASPPLKERAVHWVCSGLEKTLALARETVGVERAKCLDDPTE
jgi:hypothetical protein